MRENVQSRSAASVRRFSSIRSRRSATTVGMKAVTPRSASRRLIASIGFGEIVTEEQSKPPAPWMWESMKPGVT